MVSDGSGSIVIDDRKMEEIIMNKELMIYMSSIGAILMNKIQMGITYKGWSDEIAHEQVLESYNNLKEEMAKIIKDVTKLPVGDLLTLGFLKWDDKSEIYLIPLWAYDLIPDGTELTDIFGDKHVKGTHSIDLDARFGCIAYGLDKGGVLPNNCKHTKTYSYNHGYHTVCQECGEEV